MTELWEHKETRDTETARTKMGPYSIEVTDLDGDLSEWEIKDERGVIATGRVTAGNHFEVAKLTAMSCVSGFEAIPSLYMMQLTPGSQEAT